MRPGITGLSQVSVRNGVSFSVRLDKDLEYVRNWNQKIDGAILLKTPIAVLFPKWIYPDS